MQWRRFGAGQFRNKRVSGEPGDLLSAQAQQCQMRRRGNPPVERAIVGRRQIVRAEFHHIGAHAVEEIGLRIDYRTHQQ